MYTCSFVCNCNSTVSVTVKIRFGQARERKQLQWRESFNVFSGVGFRCGSKREKRTWSQWCHTRSA